MIPKMIPGTPRKILVSMVAMIPPVFLIAEFLLELKVSLKYTGKQACLSDRNGYFWYIIYEDIVLIVYRSEEKISENLIFYGKQFKECPVCTFFLRSNLCVSLKFPLVGYSKSRNCFESYSLLLREFIACHCYI